MSPFGKFEMRSIEMAAQPRRVHIAISHCETRQSVCAGNKCHGARRTGRSGFSPLLHLAAR